MLTELISRTMVCGENPMRNTTGVRLTPFIRPIFTQRMRSWRSQWHATESVQREVLRHLLARSRATEQGCRYGYGMLRSYEEYKSRVPVVDYTGIRSDVERMINGERDVLWPGVTKHFAQSSGTSDGRSKYIPITGDSFRQTHYRGSSCVVAAYFDMYPDTRIFDGYSMILGGSFANTLQREVPQGVTVGDLSANLIYNMNSIVNMVRVPDKRIALMADWKQKLPALVRASAGRNITNISGVPSWFLTVLRGVLEYTGASSMHDVWPNLEVFFHGGISFEPYREQYAHITDPAKMRYLETYNASEGFFGVQTSREDRSGVMTLLTDAGTFYEFIPIDQSGERFPESYGAWEVEAGNTYAMVISSCNGLWRYSIGDTVTIESLDPVKISIAGRTRSYINAFGEELMVHNAEAAMTATCHALGCEVNDYTAAPVYATDGNRGRHQWMVEFEIEPRDINEFADLLDRNLQNENSDYQAKRGNNIFLDPPEVIKAPKGLFERWLGSTGKLGGQRKVPRLSNDRKIMDRLLDMAGCRE